MKLTLVAILAVAPLALAAPVDVQTRDPQYGSYAPYSTYTPPSGGYKKYTSYGSYKRVEKEIEKREPGYASYGDYAPPKGGYSSYGDYKGAAAPTNPPPTPPPANGKYTSYGTYPKPPGGYGSYPRKVADFVKRIWA